MMIEELARIESTFWILHVADSSVMDAPFLDFESIN